METAPKPGRGVPPKKDKPQAKRKKVRRYWEEEPTPSAAGASPGLPRKKARTGEPRPPRSQSVRIAQKSRFSKSPRSQRTPQTGRSRRGPCLGLRTRSQDLSPPEPGFLVGEDGEDTAKILQTDIVEAVDVSSAAKHFDLNLRQFGPYRLNYSRTGRHLALGGRRGHVAALDWVTKKLMCEINVMEAYCDLAGLARMMRQLQSSSSSLLQELCTSFF